MDAILGTARTISKVATVTYRISIETEKDLKVNDVCEYWQKNQ